MRQIFSVTGIYLLLKQPIYLLYVTSLPTKQNRLTVKQALHLQIVRIGQKDTPKAWKTEGKYPPKNTSTISTQKKVTPKKYQHLFFHKKSLLPNLKTPEFNQNEESLSKFAECAVIILAYLVTD